jgi:molybdate transport system substrate-binding protein
MLVRPFVSSALVHAEPGRSRGRGEATAPAWQQARLVGAILAALFAAFAIACGTDLDDADSASTPTSSRLTGRISVFAAASLTDAFKTIATAFNKTHPNVSVEFNFQSSSALATQIEQAARADVFASADTTQMQRLVDMGLIAEAPVIFVKNLPVIAIPADNRAGIASANDLSKPGVKLVLAAADVPIGNYARQIIDRLAADPAYGASYRNATLKNVVSNEANVRAVLTKVELGEADAGIVYKSDAQASGPKVTAVDIPDTANVIATYPMAVVKSSQNLPAATAFITFVRGDIAQRLLQDAGFDRP